jgi:hypothetical protein
VRGFGGLFTIFDIPAVAGARNPSTANLTQFDAVYGLVCRVILDIPDKMPIA